MTYNTGNPVPSTDPRDLDDNAQAFDRFLQSNAASELDRLGIARKTWKQMERDALALVSPNVTALANAVSAANKLFYFTGSGVGGVTDFTAVGRSFLSATTQALQQSALGLVPTAGDTDQTVGSILRVGNFGVGSVQVPTVTDANAPTASGDYRISGAGSNVPVATNGLIRHVQYSSTVAFQLWMSVGNYANGMYWRTIVNGVGNAWLKIAQDSVAGGAIAALTPAANTFPYWTSGTAAANATLTAGMRAGLALTPAADQILRWTSASAAVMQSFTAGAQALAALTYAADRIGYTTSASAAAVTPLTAFGRSLIDDADAAAGRTTLGVLAQADKPAWTAYTPTITAGSGTYTSASATGKYVVLFGICYVQIAITITTVGTGVQPVATLPVAALAGSAGMPLPAKEGAINGKTGSARILSGLASVQCTDYANADLVTAAGSVIYINGSYPVA